MLKQTITAILMASAALCCTAERPALHFNDNGAFKILQFTDLHINDENDASKLRNDSTYRLIESLAKAQKPDLLVLTGDCVWNTRDAISLWKQLCPQPHPRRCRHFRVGKLLAFSGGLIERPYNSRCCLYD